VIGDYGFAAASESAAVVRKQLGTESPHLALILGSGLGGVADDLTGARSLRFSEIPGFTAASIAGHAGVLTAGLLEGRPVFALAGRMHAYEGHSLAAVAFPVRVMHALGARVLFVSNAAGGIRRGLEPGDLMMIEDQLNLMARSPLEGPLQEGDERFPDLGNAYDPSLRQLLITVARDRKIDLKRGVYAGLRGPNYETAAEVRMLERLGADAVGMSTVPEVIVARALGMRVAGVSCITNLACGRGEAPLKHEEVLETTARIGATFRTLVRGFVGALI
jgi:purine-nucleoside phosphorylase